MHGDAWTLGTADITESTSGSITLGNTSQKWWYTGSSSTGFNYGYITGTVNAIDLPGEWAVENGNLLMQLPTEETADKLSVEVKQRQLVIDLTDSEYIHIENLHTVGGSIKMNNSNMCMLTGNQFEYISHFTDCTDFRDGYISTANPQNSNGEPQQGELGIYIGGRDNVIRNNKLNYSAGAGMIFVGCYALVENNVVSNCGYMSTELGSIAVTTEAFKAYNTARGGHAFYHNTIYNSGRSGFTAHSYEPWLWSSTIPVVIPYEFAYNDVHDASIAARDTGDIYTWGLCQGTDSHKTKVHHNLIYHKPTTKNSYIYMLYNDNYVQMTENYENIFFYEHSDNKPKYFVYVQRKSQFPTSYANVDAWNNSVLGLRSGGVDSITAADYPGGKPVSIGSSLLNNKPYLENYKRITSDCVLSAEEAELSANVKIEDGLACFEQNGAYIRFKNVPFTDSRKTIYIYFAGDCYNTGDTFAISAGGIDNGAVAATLTVESPYLNGTNTLAVTLSNVSSTQDVFIQLKNGKSAKISGICLAN